MIPGQVSGGDLMGHGPWSGVGVLKRSDDPQPAAGEV